LGAAKRSIAIRKQSKSPAGRPTTLGTIAGVSQRLHIKKNTLG